MVRSRFKIYIYLGFLFILSLLALAFYFANQAETITNLHKRNSLSSSQGAVIMLLLAIVLFILYAIPARVIRITEKKISVKNIFKNISIPPDEIASINLFAKEYTFTASARTLVIRIEAINRKEILINDIFYRNTAQLRKALSESFPDKIAPYKMEKRQRSFQTGFDPETEKFSGNPHTSLNGLLFYAIVIAFVLILLKRPSGINEMAGFLLFIPVVYLFFGSQLNYFLVSDHTLIIKNHFFIWMNKRYEVKDIIETNFEIPYRRSKAVRITTANFKSRVFSAGSLRNKTWSRLSEKFKDLNVYFVE